MSVDGLEDSTLRAGLRSLTPDRFARINALLDEVLDLAPSQRLDWLAALDLREPESAPQVRKLLASYDPDSASVGRLGQLPQIAADDDSHSSALYAGQKIGLYTLESRLGVGGMGEVWRAQRNDGTLDRAVALKLPHTGGFDLRLLPRFSRERDILARLNHPNIARLYDAGVVDGQPFLALELVDGISISDYCTANGLGLRARVALFAQVIDAVQYAHTNLVVHRDIKPSNILVTAEGIVKLLDFGIAKPTEHDGQEDGNATQLTRLAGRALTPRYASPEQIKGEPVSTASDVYSLGVVLYELLTGLTPYAGMREPQSSLAPAQLEAVVLEQAPTRPSASPITQPFTEVLRISPRALRRDLSDGLDAVLLTALAKAPVERYAGVSVFGDDLKMWLAGKPVKAQPPSNWYLARKFVARHRLAVLTGAAALGAILVSAGAATWQAQRATLAAQTTGEVKQFLVDMLAVNSGRRASSLSAQANRQTTAEQLLKNAAQKMQVNTTIAPQVRKELLGVVGDLTHELHMNEDAAKLREQRLVMMDDSTEKAQGFLDLIDTYYQAGKTKEADDAVARAKTLAPSIPAAQKPHFDARLQMREGRQLDFVGKHALSTPMLEQASAALKGMSPSHEEWIEAQSHYLDGLRHTNPQATISGYEALISTLETQYGRDAPALIPVLKQYAATLGLQQKVPQAKIAFARLNALHQLHPDYDPVGASLVLAEQGAMLRTWGDLAAARPQLEKALRNFEEAQIGDHPGEPTTARLGYAALLLSEWDFAQADAKFAQVERISRKAARALLTASVLEVRALTSSLQGRTDEARTWLSEARALRAATLPPTHITFAVNEGRAIANEASAGNLEMALKRYAALREIPDPQKGELPTFLLEGSKIDAMPALIAAKQWSALLSDNAPIIARPQSSPIYAQRTLLALVRQARAQSNLGDPGAAQKSIAEAETIAQGLGENVPQPLRAQLALQRLSSLVIAKARPEIIGQAREVFRAQRALLKGETRDFKMAADEIGE